MIKDTPPKQAVGGLFVLAALVVIIIVAVVVRNRGAEQSSGEEGGGTEDTLVVGFENAPRSSDPRMVGFDANSQYLEELRFLPLFSFHPDGSLRPLLAESLLASDETTFVVKLRSGLTFSDGTPITPHDVVATYKHMLFPEGGFPPSPRKGAFAAIKSVFKSGPYEVTFKLKQPDAAFPTNLVIGILPEASLGNAPEDVNGKGFESGPYILADHTDAEWTLVRNDAFDGSSMGIARPQIRRVKFKVIRDATTRYAALVRGDLDILQNDLDADKVVSLQSSASFNILTQTRMGIDYLGFNTERPPLDNRLVRLAIAHGVNREEILKYTLQGLAVKASGMFPDEFPWKAPAEPLPYDPDKARELLDEAGLTVKPDSGTRFTLNLKVTTSKARIAVAKAIAAQLKDIGIDVEVESLEFGVFMDRLREGAISSWLASWTGFKDPDHLHFCFHSSMAPPEGGNRGRYRNAELDDLLGLGKTESDPEKRRAYYLRAQKIVEHDQPYAFLWHPRNVTIVKRNVKGFRLYSDGRYLSLPEVSREQ